MESRDILFDREIAGIESSIARFGRVRGFDGRNLTASDLGDSEVLIVRSVTTVDQTLLADSRVKLVCSATAGIDHIDTGFLEKSGIDFFSTRGCNSKAVVEYVVSSIFLYAISRELSFSEIKVGIVGFGNIGRSLAEMLSRLGVSFLVNDPPLQENTGESFFSNIKKILACDVVTLHVPLIKDGPFPTENLINLSRLRTMRESSLIINTSRGGVINESDLLEVMTDRDDLYVILDCWSKEPSINLSLIPHVWKASPHIAGSSLESRYNSVVALSEKLANYFGTEFGGSNWITELNRENKVIILHKKYFSDLLDEIMPINSCTVEMKSLDKASTIEQVGKRFDRTRKRFGNRKDFCYYQVDPVFSEKELLTKLGFLIGTC